MADSNYHRGEMNIEDHTGTFGGFMTFSKYGGAAIIVTLLFPILVFGANVAWPASLLVSVILGIIIGVILKFNARWHALLVASALVLAVSIALLTLIF